VGGAELVRLPHTHKWQVFLPPLPLPTVCGLQVKGIVRRNLRWVVRSINRQPFPYCLGACTLFNLKGHHPLK
jgi:hypothetical protein